MIIKKRRYELLFLISSREEALKNEIEYIKSVFAEKSVTFDREIEIGVKKLAYPVKKQLKGYYHAFYFEVNTQLIKEILKEFRFREDIFRSLIIELEKKDWDCLKELEAKKKEQTLAPTPHTPPEKEAIPTPTPTPTPSS